MRKFIGIVCMLPFWISVAIVVFKAFHPSTGDLIVFGLGSLAAVGAMIYE